MPRPRQSTLGPLFNGPDRYRALKRLSGGSFSAPSASAKALRATFTPETWTAATRESYSRFLAIRAAEDRVSDVASRAQGEQHTPAPPLAAPPSLKISGQTLTDPTVNTSKLSPLAVHTSLPLLRVLKGLNDFSNNWMATIIGNLVGGPDAVERFLKSEVGFKEDEVRFATSSGLGSNFISPRNTITMLRKLITYLDGKGLALEDILPIAGGTPLDLAARGSGNTSTPAAPGAATPAAFQRSTSRRRSIRRL